jgi:hypothetical protein
MKTGGELTSPPVLSCRKQKLQANQLSNPVRNFCNGKIFVEKNLIIIYPSYFLDLCLSFPVVFLQDQFQREIYRSAVSDRWRVYKGWKVKYPTPRN